ncbi:MAG: DNA translocase FtsK 4TM domain-containing protein [Phycisphaerae bacterium]
MKSLGLSAKLVRADAKAHELIHHPQGKESRGSQEEEKVSSNPIVGRPGFHWLDLPVHLTALLTFDIADWPNPSHAPHNQPTTNACGNAGAFVAFQMFYWIGDGAYILALFATMASFLWLVHGKVVSIVQRTFGVTILIASVATSVSFISTGGYETLAIGDGGVLGAAIIHAAPRVLQRRNDPCSGVQLPR